MNKHFLEKKGFTIVETLVAIAILMIAIAGPMVAASRGLNAALYSRDQMIASFLAIETMEVIKSDRSNIFDVGGPGAWPTAEYRGCEASSVCDIGAIDNLAHCATNQGCTISLDSNGNYSRGGSGVGIKFKRYFYLVPVTNPDSTEELEAHVFVKWSQGLVPYEIELISQLTEKTR